MVQLDYFFKFRQYNPYSASQGIVEKVWNNGNGSLALFRFYENEKIILVNECLCNKADKKHLNEFMEQNDMQAWNVVYKSYGYPEYYRHTFHM